MYRKILLIITPDLLWTVLISLPAPWLVGFGWLLGIESRGKYSLNEARLSSELITLH